MYVYLASLFFQLSFLHLTFILTKNKVIKDVFKKKVVETSKTLSALENM